MQIVDGQRVSWRGIGRVGDLGCGPGRVTAYLRGRGLDAFGVDLSPGMVKVELDSSRMSPDRVNEELTRTGFAVHVRMTREPADAYETTQQAYLLARRT